MPPAMSRTAPGRLNRAKRAYIHESASATTITNKGNPNIAITPTSRKRGRESFLGFGGVQTKPTSSAINPGQAAQAYHDPPSCSRACQPSGPRRPGSSPLEAM